MSNILKNTFIGNKRIQDIASNTLCLSLKKIRSEYSGDCLRLRRSSDNSESDFGFDSAGDIDTSAISTWGTTDTLYVVTWYDQSGWGNDANQSTYANQPTWNNTNKKIVFTASNSNYLIVSNANSLNVDISDFSYVAQAKFTSLPTTFHLFFKGSFSSPRIYMRMVYYSSILRFATEDVSAPEESANYNTPSIDTDYTFIGMKIDDDLKAYTNGNLDNTTGISSSYGSLSTSSNLFVGSQNGSEYLNGSMTALLLFKKALDDEEIAMISDI